MTNLGIENELVGYSEFDKYASASLSAIHGVSEELNYGDITKIDEKDVPVECWRLMGFTDEDYWKTRQILEDRFYDGKDRSDRQMYKMAGNSIVVDVLEGIFRMLLCI